MALTALLAVKVKIRTSQAGIRGFTLLELLFVLFIVVLTASVVIFSIGRLHEKTVFNDETRKVYQTMKRARELSLIERRDVILRIDEDENRYWIDNGGDKALYAHSLRKGLVITGKEVIFFPKGNSSGGLIKIANGKGQEYTIEVDPVLGAPSIKRF